MEVWVSGVRRYVIRALAITLNYELLPPDPSVFEEMVDEEWYDDAEPCDFYTISHRLVRSLGGSLAKVYKGWTPIPGLVSRDDYPYIMTFRLEYTVKGIIVPVYLILVCMFREGSNLWIMAMAENQYVDLVEKTMERVRLVVERMPGGSV